MKPALVLCAAVVLAGCATTPTATAPANAPTVSLQIRLASTSPGEGLTEMTTASGR
jgi:hypothetical protein